MFLPHKYGMLSLLTGIYVCMLLVGVATAHYAADLKSPIDCLLFAVTNSTSCGLLVGDQSKLDWLWTGISLILSVPASAAWTSEVTHLAFTKYEKFEENAYALEQPDSESTAVLVDKAEVARLRREAERAESLARDIQDEQRRSARLQAQVDEARRLGFLVASAPPPIPPPLARDPEVEP